MWYAVPRTEECTQVGMIWSPSVIRRGESAKTKKEGHQPPALRRGVRMDKENAAQYEAGNLHFRASGFCRAGINSAPVCAPELPVAEPRARINDPLCSFPISGGSKA